MRNKDLLKWPFCYDPDSARLTYIPTSDSENTNDAYWLIMILCENKKIKKEKIKKIPKKIGKT